jgi:hypothetical protein
MDHFDRPPRRGRRLALLTALGLVAVVIFSACASSLVRQDTETESMAVMGERSEEALTGKVAFEMDGVVSDLVAPLPAADGRGAVGFDDRVAQAPDRIDDALIVRTASLELEVGDVAAILALARGEIGSLGGYVAGSDEYDQGDRRWASVSYRVPVDRFGEALEKLRGLSDRVVRESTQSQEVTASVVDLDARIANLRASEEALVEIMDRSGRMEDVLAVQMRLEDVRGQIERLDAQRANLADQAALSTLTVTWFTPVAAVTAAQEGWNVGAEVDAAMAQTVRALQGLASMGIWLGVVILPLLAIPVLLAVSLYVVLRRRGSNDGPDDTPTLSATAAE